MVGQAAGVVLRASRPPPGTAGGTAAPEAVAAGQTPARRASASAIHAARNACSARAAVGLEHVAIERDGPLAQRVEVHDRPQAPAQEPLDLDAAAVGFAVAVARFPR